MIVYQNGKLYAQHDDKLVGVNVTPTGISEVEGTDTKLDKSFELLELHEVMCRFGIYEGKSFKFPIKQKAEPQKEVVENGQTNDIKKPARKSTRK